MLIAFYAANSFSQTIARIKDLKDGFGSVITYVGEVKNGKPNGIGIALYNSDNTASYYAGYFVNGQFSGKGVLVFNHGGFISGDWKNGKVYGKGASLSKTGDFYKGDFINGEKNGNGTLVYKDNGFLTGQFKTDDYNGRCIFISSKGEILTDNIYVKSKKQGSGYQYGSDDKKLWEGEWSNGEWVREYPASYASFIKKPSFYSEKTGNQILMGGVDKSNNNVLQDTAFFFDLKMKKRYFGKYEKGFLKSGLVIRDDSTRFLGTLNDNGATGNCSFLKMNNFYDEGNYVNDLLDGSNCLSVDIKKKTVYYGSAKGGKFTGKAFFADIDKSLCVGDYVNGKFTGSGYIIRKDGSFTKGTWEDGYPVKVAVMNDGNGKAVQLNPKNFSEAFSFLNEQYKETFELLKGKLAYDDEVDDEDYAFNSGLYNLPGSLKNFAVTDFVDDTYLSLYLKTTDEKKAIAKYNELCKAVLSTTVARPGYGAVKMEGEIEDEASFEPNTVSKFHFAGDNTSNFNICVIVRKVHDDYMIFLSAGSYNLMDNWIG
jgi:hypothetical protein